MSHGRFRSIASEESGHSRIAGPIERRGPTVDVKIHLHRDELERHRMEALTAPLPYPTRGLLDTGAEQTCLGSSIIESLALEPVMHTRLETALGAKRVAVYSVTLELAWRQDRPPDPISLQILGIPEVLGAEILIGLDVLRLGKLVLFGPDGRYELFLPRTGRSSP